MTAHVIISYHLPEGFLRWKRLTTMPGLTDLGHRVLLYLLETQPAHTNAEQLAVRFGAGRGRMYETLRQLETWGFFRRVRVSDGYRQWRHFWQLTDEPGAFPPSEHFDYPGASSEQPEQEDAQVDSCDGLRQSKPVTEPVCSFGSRSKPPNPHPVDNRRRPVTPRLRRSRPPATFDLDKIAAEDQPHAWDALALLEGLGVVPGDRVALVPPVARALRRGWAVGDLTHFFTTSMGSARNRIKVLRYRAARIPALASLR